MILTSGSTQELIVALDAFQTKAIHVPKGAYNPFYESKYADLFSIKQICDPVLVEVGLLITQFLGGAEYGVPTLITRLIHVASGQYMEAETPLVLDKDNSQGHGSAVTYVRRYSYCAILGIVADPDDDGNAASSPRQTSQGRPVAVANQEYETVNGDQIPVVAGDPIVRTNPAGQQVTEKQGKMLFAMCKTAYGADCDPKAQLTAIVGRPINRTEEVTTGEFDRVLARLKADGA